MKASPNRPAEQRLLASVRPADWDNPTPRDRYDLAVVGGGTGGLVSAAIAAAVGASVALVERNRLGGDCLNFGCVPSKGLLRAARSWTEARMSAERFGGPRAAEGGDFSEAVGRMRGIRADMSATDSAERFRSLGVDVFLGDARFTGRDAMEVDGSRLPFRRAILATGARAAVPSIPGLDHIDYHTNESIFDLDAPPRRLVILGAGPVGCELAQAFARFGSQVTLLDREERVLAREEPDAAMAVQRALSKDGVTFVGGARVVSVGEREGVCLARYERANVREELGGDVLLLALGRTPNVDSGLDVAGVEFDPDDGVRVDDRLRTTNRRIYAVGDVTSSLRFTHVADAHARIAVRNALFYGRGRASDLVVPWAVYTSPELARVGMSSMEAEERGVAVDTFTVPLSEVDRARLDGDPDGFLRVHVKAGTDRIVGATLVAPHAGELIAQVVQAIVTGTGLKALSGIIFPYPTVSEALRKAADAHQRMKLTDGASRVLQWFLRASRYLP